MNSSTSYLATTSRDLPPFKKRKHVCIYIYIISLPVSATPRSLFLSRSHTFTSVLLYNPALGIMRWYILNPQDLLPGCTIPQHQNESATRLENSLESGIYRGESLFPGDHQGSEGCRPYFAPLKSLKFHSSASHLKIF